jgi:hypothetical protein
MGSHIDIVNDMPMQLLDARSSALWAISATKRMGSDAWEMAKVKSNSGL